MTAHPLTELGDPFCLGQAELRGLLSDAPWRRFAVIGDSLSRGTGAPTPNYRDLGWSDRVAEVLPGTAYLNLAQVGATTDQVIEDQVPRLVDFDPDLVHVPCGANDILDRAPDFEAIERDLRRLWDLAAATGATVQTFTLGRAFQVPAFADWGERIQRINALTRTIAAEHDAVVVDVWDHPVNDRANLVSPDGIHFSTSGQAVLATEVVRALTAHREEA